MQLKFTFYQKQEDRNRQYLKTFDFRIENRACRYGITDYLNPADGNQVPLCPKLDTLYKSDTQI